MTLSFVTRGQEHDLRMHVEDGKLWIVPPSGQLYKEGANKTPSIVILQDNFSARLVDSLQRMGKALNLMRISAQLSSNGGAAASTMEVGMTVTRKGGGVATPLNAGTVQLFADGDSVEVSLKNKSRAAIDVTALYIDADFGINVLFPDEPGVNNRSEAGAIHRFKIVMEDSTVGLERLVLIGVEARAGADRYDFSFMKQARLERARGEAGDDVSEIFKAAGFGVEALDLPTRGNKMPVPGRTQMQVFPFKVLGRRLLVN